MFLALLEILLSVGDAAQGACGECGPQPSEAAAAPPAEPGDDSGLQFAAHFDDDGGRRHSRHYCDERECYLVLGEPVQGGVRLADGARRRRPVGGQPATGTESTLQDDPSLCMLKPSH